MSIVKVIKKSELPISMELIYQHLRVGSSPIDSEIIKLKADAALDWAEQRTNRYIRQRDIVVMGITNEHGVMKMPVGSYDVRLIEPGDCVWAYNEFHEAICIDGARNANIKVEAKVGYTDGDLPESILVAVLMMTATFYDNESDQVVGRAVNQLSVTAEKLVAPFRITPYGDV